MSDDSDSDEIGEALKALRIHQLELETQNAELRRLQQELGRSHARYLDLYEHAPVGYLTLSPDGKITECNLTGAALLEVDKAALQGKPLTDFIHVEDQDAYYLWRQQRFPLMRPTVLELRLRRSQAPFWARLEVSTTKTAEGAPSWRVAISDVDQLKSAERAVASSERRYRTLFDGALEALFTLSPPHWRVSSANDAAEALFPGSPMIGRGLWEASPALQKEGFRSEEAYQAAIDSAAQTGSTEFEWLHQRGSGETFLATVRLARLEIEGEPLILASVRDETEARRAHQAEARLERRANLSVLASGLAHELNNPLALLHQALEELQHTVPALSTAIKYATRASRAALGDATVAAMLGEQVAAALEDSALQAMVARVKEAFHAAQRILRMSRALGTFARLENVDGGPAELGRAINLAVSLLPEQLMERVSVIPNPEGPSWVRGTEGLVSQLFLNLLLNGAGPETKESSGPVIGGVNPPAGAIAPLNASGPRSVRVTQEGEPSSVAVVVADDGPGVAAARLDAYFEPSSSQFDQLGLSGLGLTICKNIVEEIGATITVESKPGEGTRVRIRFDRAAAPTPPPEARAPSGRRGRILLVDDEPALRQSLARWLQPLHDVVTVPSGLEAQVTLKLDAAFDLIITDLMMPGLGGLGLYGWLEHAHPQLAQRILFMTGGSLDPSVKASLDQAGRPTLEKPFDTRRFRRLVNELVERSQKD